MKLYEIVFLLRQEISVQDAHNVCEKLVNHLSIEHTGEIQKFEYWGSRELEFKIKKNKRAHYYLCTVLMHHELVKELEKFFKFNDSVIRHIVLHVTEDRADLNRPSLMLVNKDRDIESLGVIYDPSFEFHYKK